MGPSLRSGTPVCGRLVGVVHGVVEGLEEGFVFFGAVVGGVAQGFYALGEDLGGFGLGLDEVDGFGDEVFEGHGSGVGGLGAAHEFGLDVGWDDFDDFDVGGAKLVAEGLAPGVDGGLGGAVGGGEGHGDEAEAGGFGEDGGVGLLEELGEQGSGEADGAEEVGGDGCFGVGQGLVGRLREEVFGAHDAGVVDDDVEGWVGGGEFGGYGADVGRVFDVEGDGGHAGVGGGGVVEDGLAAAGDDDFVAEGVEGFGEGAADAGAAAGDEDGVSGDVHGDRCLLRVIVGWLVSIGK